MIESTFLTPVGTYDEWFNQIGVVLIPDSPRNIRQLAEDMDKGEVALIADGDEIKRYGRTAYLNVYFQNSDGRVFQALEHRYTLKPGVTIDDYLREGKSVLNPSVSRPTTCSLSERMKVAAQEEEPLEGAMRAIREELFTFARAQSPNDERFVGLDDTIRRSLVEDEPYRNERGPFEPGNSYQGLSSVLDIFPYNITFTSSMGVPIDVDDTGRPKELLEYHEGKPYVNIFEWEEIQ